MKRQEVHVKIGKSTMAYRYDDFREFLGFPLAREYVFIARPGAVSKFTIDLWATSHVFLPGHCIRVEISSSNFPRFDRNLNTGDDPATATRMQTAQQTIFHDQRYPSHITLPVIPR